MTAAANRVLASSLLLLSGMAAGATSAARTSLYVRLGAGTSVAAVVAAWPE